MFHSDPPNKVLILYRKDGLNIDNLDCLLAVYLLKERIRQTISDITIKGIVDNDPDCESLTGYNTICIVGVIVNQKILKQWQRKKAVIYLFECRKDVIEQITKDRKYPLTKNVYLNEKHSCIRLIWYLEPEDPCPLFMLLACREIETPGKNFKNKIIKTAIESYIATLTVFKKAKISMIFLWFDYLTTLNQEEVFEELQEVGRSVLDYKNKNPVSLIERKIEQEVEIRLKQKEEAEAKRSRTPKKRSASNKPNSLNKKKKARINKSKSRDRKKRR